MLTFTQENNNPESLYADLLEARTARLNGYQGRNGREVLEDMRKMISVVSAEQSKRRSRIP